MIAYWEEISFKIMVSGTNIPEDMITEMEIETSLEVPKRPPTTDDPKNEVEGNVTSRAAIELAPVVRRKTLRVTKKTIMYIGRNTRKNT